MSCERIGSLIQVRGREEERSLETSSSVIGLNAESEQEEMCEGRRSMLLGDSEIISHWCCQF